MIRKQRNLVGKSVTILYVCVLVLITLSGCSSEKNPQPAVFMEDSYHVVKAFTSRSTESRENTYELTQIIGQPINKCEQLLGVTFTKQSSQIYYASEKQFLADDIKLFTCEVDESGVVCRITLHNSGKNNYTLYGVSSEMGTADAQQNFSQAGLTLVSENIWQCPNENDGVFYSNTGWVYEKGSEELQSAIRKAAILAAYEYQYEDSIGWIDIGNNQILEYYHNSFAALAGRYNAATEYAKTEMAAAMHGRYVYVSGNVAQVGQAGRITVNCRETEVADADGRLWPYTGTAYLNIVSEQQSVLASISQNSIVTALGRIDASSYHNIIGAEFDLTDAIILTVDGKDMTIPKINKAIPGIQTYEMNGNAVVFGEKVDVADINRQFIGLFTAEQLLEEYASNAMRAKENYLNQYIELTGTVSSIPADSDYFDMDSGSWLTSGSIKCEYTENNQKEAIYTINEGDTVTIQCRVVDIGGFFSTYTVEVLGFSESIS